MKKTKKHYPILNYLILLASLFFCSLLSLSFLMGQNEASEADLNQEIASLEKQIEQEQVFFEEFKKIQNQAISEREIEKKAIGEEIQDRIKQIKSINDEVVKLETQIKEIEAFNTEIKNYFLSFAERIREQIQNGIPFEKDKRLSTISILLSDLESENFTVNEAFSRINNFLSSELALGFDSQSIKVIENINGVDKEFELLRIGRIFFALIDGENVLVWEKDGSGYKVSPVSDLSVREINTIKNISDMVQGRKAPEISPIPLKID